MWLNPLMQSIFISWGGATMSIQKMSVRVFCMDLVMWLLSQVSVNFSYMMVWLRGPTGNCWSIQYIPLRSFYGRTNYLNSAGVWPKWNVVRTTYLVPLQNKNKKAVKQSCQSYVMGKAKQNKNWIKDAVFWVNPIRLIVFMLTF